MDLPPRVRWVASTPSSTRGFGGNPLWAMRRLAPSRVASRSHSEQVPALQVATDVRFRPSADEASSFGLEQGASEELEVIPRSRLGGEHRSALVSDNQTYRPLDGKSGASPLGTFVNTGGREGVVTHCR